MSVLTYAVLRVYRIHLEEIVTTTAVSTVIVSTLVHTVTYRDALVYIWKLGNNRN